MLLKPGVRLQSSTCSTQVIIVRGPGEDVDLRCGGRPMVAAGEAIDTTPPAPDLAAGTEMGKRYANPDGTLEILCTKPGAGTLTIGDEVLPLKDAKPLPSSD